MYNRISLTWSLNNKAWNIQDFPTFAFIRKIDIETRFLLGSKIPPFHRILFSLFRISVCSSNSHLYSDW